MQQVINNIANIDTMQGCAPCLFASIQMGDCVWATLRNMIAGDLPILRGVGYDIETLRTELANIATFTRVAESENGLCCWRVLDELILHETTDTMKLYSYIARVWLEEHQCYHAIGIQRHRNNTVLIDTAPPSMMQLFRTPFAFAEHLDSLKSTKIIEAIYEINII